MQSFNRKTIPNRLKLIFFLYRIDLSKAIHHLDKVFKINEGYLIKYHQDTINRKTLPIIDKSPYYKFTKYRNIDLNRVSFKSWTNLPILKKLDIQNISKKQYGLKNRLFIEKRKTSGSTGIPLVIPKSPLTLAYERASQWHFYSQYGINFFRDKQLRIWGAPNDSYKKLLMRIYDKMLNRYRISAFDIDPKKIDQQVYSIEKFRPDYIYGYAQATYIFSSMSGKYLHRLRNLNLKAVIVTGEMISESQIDHLKKFFNCPVINEYGCSEVGIIAFQCPYGKMHLSEGNLFIEHIHNSNYFDGSKEILLTEMYSNYFPIIRYQLGDMVVFSSEKCNCGNSFRIIESIKGRSDQFIITSNNRHIDPAFFSYIIKDLPKKYGKIIGYNIIQKKLDLLEITVVTGGNYNQSMNNWIMQEVQKYFYKDISIKIIFTKFFNLKKSGKINSFERHF